MYVTIVVDRDLTPRVQPAAADRELVLLGFDEQHADGARSERVKVFLSREQARALRAALDER